MFLKVQAALLLGLVMGILLRSVPSKVSSLVKEARVSFPSQKNQKEVRNYGVVTPRATMTRLTLPPGFTQWGQKPFKNAILIFILVSNDQKMVK